MLNAFIQAEQQKIHFPNANQVDLVLSQRIRVYLLQAQEAGKLASMCNVPPALPTVHILARQGLLRCIDVLNDFFHCAIDLDKDHRNYFHYLIAIKKYAIANKMIERSKVTGDPSFLLRMTDRNRVEILGLLANAVKKYDKEAITLLQSILMDSKSKYQEPSLRLQNASERKLLALLKTAFKSCKKTIKPMLEKVNRQIKKLYDGANSIRKLARTPEQQSSALNEKLNAHYRELAKLSAESKKLQSQIPVDEQAAQKWANLCQCQLLFKEYLGEKCYKALDISDDRVKKIRLMR